MSHTIPASRVETYLGDGLFVSFDGDQFKLRAPRLDGDHEVYLDIDVLNSFKAYVGRVLELDKALAELNDD